MRGLDEFKKLDLMANTLRQDVINMLNLAGSGHSAGSLGMADVFTALYFNILNHNPKNPSFPNRDRLILSNGHICPVRYAAMARAGYFSAAKLKSLRKLGSELQGHPHYPSLKAVESSSGPLGQGISVACGMALAAKLDEKSHHIFCIASDAEFDEGESWEALLFASKYKLDNLTVIVDRNCIQLSGFTQDIMPLEPLRQKFESFNVDVFVVDGHNISKIIMALNAAKSTQKPAVVITHTIPGKGVSFMENLPEWHGKAPDNKQAKAAIKELENRRKLI
jgi:transketolase